MAQPYEKSAKYSDSDQAQAKRVLVLLFNGIEEVEAIAPVDILRRADVEVTLASIETDLLVEGRNSIRIQADCLLDAVDPNDFDLVFIPGGPGVLPLAENENVLEMIRNRDRNKTLLAAICAAPKVLAAAGVLQNREATSHSSVRQDLPIPSDKRIVVSDHIITSQGAGTAIELGLKLAETLTDSDTAQTIAQSIHA